MREIELYNGTVLDDLCYGTGIVLSYRYGKKAYYNKLKYYTKNIIKERKKFVNDINIGRVVKAAFENGCTMFDTSRAYGGAEYALGKALSNYQRDNYRIVTKLSNYDQYNSTVRESLENSLRELKTDYVDLYLMHWPVPNLYINNWHEMEKLYREGKCKAIGVCNCNIHHLEDIISSSDMLPMVNQFECHPFFTQNELRNYCESRGIKVMAYTSTARMDPRLQNTCIPQIATKYNKSVSQIILRWHQQIGNIPIFNTYNVKHLEQNVRIDDFTLTIEEVHQISSEDIGCRLRFDPDNCDFRRL